MTCTLAVACEKDAVAPHFGNSPEFAVFEILENRINGLRKVSAAPDDAAHIALLRKLNARVLLCGALESSARAALEEALEHFHDALYIFENAQLSERIKKLTTDIARTNQSLNLL